MNQHGIRYLHHETEKQSLPDGFHPRKQRETYIANHHKDLRVSSTKELKPFTTSPARFGKPDNSPTGNPIPPRAAPFQRSRNISIQKKPNERSEYLSAEKGSEENRRQVLRFSQLKKKLQQEMKERERLQELNACNELKLGNLQQEINKLRTEKKQLERAILSLQKTSEENSGNLAKAQQKIQQLSRNLKEVRLNQKSLSNLKNLQNQLQYLQERNKKLVAENQELLKQNKTIKADLQKLTRESTESECSINAKAEEMEAKILGQLAMTKSERELFLENNFQALEKRLYEKQNQIKKLQIQLNCIDRKKVLSINQVKSKKDEQIKNLRQKFMKVSKDLKETKDKFEKNEKKKGIKDSAFLRKVKSSKHLGMTSESQEVTFEFSSQA